MAVSIADKLLASNMHGHFYWDTIVKTSPPISKLTNAQRKVRYDWLMNTINATRGFIDEDHTKAAKFKCGPNYNEAKKNIKHNESVLKRLMQEKMLYPH
jgi:hypothetical protein